MAPSTRTKVDPKGSAKGTGESSDTTPKPVTINEDGLDLASDSEEEVAAGLGLKGFHVLWTGVLGFNP